MGSIEGLQVQQTLCAVSHGVLSLLLSRGVHMCTAITLKKQRCDNDVSFKWLVSGVLAFHGIGQQIVMG